MRLRRLATMKGVNSFEACEIWAWSGAITNLGDPEEDIFDRRGWSSLTSLFASGALADDLKSTTRNSWRLRGIHVSLAATTT